MDRNNRLNALIPFVLLFMGIVFMAIGVARGEAFLVFSKAIRVCLECIGIG